MKEEKTIGFYDVVKTTLRKYKGMQLNYDSAIDNLAIEITTQVLDVFDEQVKRIFNELRREMGIESTDEKDK